MGRLLSAVAFDQFHFFEQFDLALCLSRLTRLSAKSFNKFFRLFDFLLLLFGICLQGLTLLLTGLYEEIIIAAVRSYPFRPKAES
jgi:hypothetical protein